MAFEAYLNQDKVKPKARRITYTVSVVVHVAALAVGLVYSFWHVEELSPPNVTVTFMAAPPPPPPPQPPPKKKSSSTKTKPKTEIIQPKPDQIIQPKEEVKEEPEEEEEDEGEDDGVEGGVEGGVKGGVVGGVIGGVVGGTGEGAPPTMVAPNIGEKQILSRIDPTLPPAMRKAGMLLFNMTKVCVGKAGDVVSVTVIKPSDPIFDEAVKTAVKQWRFKPYSVNGNPVPFCYAAKFVYKASG